FLPRVMGRVFNSVVARDFYTQQSNASSLAGSDLSVALYEGVGELIDLWGYLNYTPPGVSCGTVMYGGISSGAFGINLEKSLASEAMLAEAQAGRGIAMARAGTSTVLRDESRLVAQYGGSAGQWAKLRTASFVARDGTRFEI